MLRKRLAKQFLVAVGQTVPVEGMLLPEPWVQVAVRLVNIGIRHLPEDLAIVKILLPQVTLAPLALKLVAPGTVQQTFVLCRLAQVWEGKIAPLANTGMVQLV